MYSYEDRIRAVKLYIKLGLRVGATLRHGEHARKCSKNPPGRQENLPTLKANDIATTKKLKPQR